MRLTKALGLALVVVAAAVAVLNPGSASPQGGGDPEVVICNKSEVLCAKGEYRIRKGITLKAKEAIFLGVLEAQTCSDAELTGRYVGMGNPLLMEFVTLRFYGTCSPCATVTVEDVSHGKIFVAANDVYTLLLSFKVKMSCPFGQTCKFEVPDAVLAIHNTAAGAPEFLAVEEEIIVEEKEFLCGTVGGWDTKFKNTFAPLEYWFALYKLTQHESELTTEQEHTEILEAHEEDLEKE